MRIALVTGEFPPMEGGVGAFTRELGKAFFDLGHEIHIISSRLARPKLERSEQKRQISALFEPVDLGWGMLHPVIRRWGWGSLAQVADIVDHYDIELVNMQYQAAAYHMKHIAPNLLPWRLKGLVPVIVTFHDLRVPYLFPKAGRWRKKAVYQMAQQAAGVIVTNELDGMALESIIPAEKKALIPIGSNIPLTAVVEEAQMRTLYPEAPFLLGYFGFLNESKGGDDLIEALTLLPEGIELVFIGGEVGSSDGTNRGYANYIKEKIMQKGLGDRVRWTGFLPDADLSRVLTHLDLLVLPYRDGVSLRRGTLMAGLQHGKAIISCEPEDEISLEGLESGKHIWLVPAKQPDKLAEAILLLREDEPLREQLGQKAKEFSRSFSWDQIGRETVAFFERRIKGGI